MVGKNRGAKTSKANNLIEQKNNQNNVIFFFKNRKKDRSQHPKCQAKITAV